jgi:hypothetical protein
LDNHILQQRPSTCRGATLLFVIATAPPRTNKSHGSDEK